jgi:hypothetical protein
MLSEYEQDDRCGIQKKYVSLFFQQAPNISSERKMVKIMDSRAQGEYTARCTDGLWIKLFQLNTPVGYTNNFSLIHSMHFLSDPFTVQPVVASSGTRGSPNNILAKSRHASRDYLHDFNDAFIPPKGSHLHPGG